MKRKIILGSMITLCSMVSTAHAEFIFYSDGSTACNQVAGNWRGHGKASNWMIGTCEYHGGGSISPVDAQGSFDVKTTVDKDSGSFLCPKQVTKKLSGTCTEGVVKLHTEFGDLSGHFTQTSGDASGTLTVAPGVKAKVEIQFNRD